MKKHMEKTVYLENQSNLRFEGLLEDDNETWDETEAKVKNVLVEKLDFESAPENERAHRTGRARRQDGTSKPRRVVCKFTSYKAKETILKRARRIKPEGLNIFEDQQLRRQWRKEGHNCLSSNKPKINLLTSPSTN